MTIVAYFKLLIQYNFTFVKYFWMLFTVNICNECKKKISISFLIHIGSANKTFSRFYLPLSFFPSFLLSFLPSFLLSFLPPHLVLLLLLLLLFITFFLSSFFIWPLSYTLSFSLFESFFPCYSSVSTAATVAINSWVYER